MKQAMTTCDVRRRSRRGVVAALEDEPPTATDSLRIDVTRTGEAAPASARLVDVCLRFGVPMTSHVTSLSGDVPRPVQPGSITLITGASGSGKSTVLHAMAQHLPTSRFVHKVPFPDDVAVVDAVAVTESLGAALGVLTACGVGEPMLWARRFSQLSDGERFRVQLARAVGMVRREARRARRCAIETGTPVEIAPLLCDEFGAVLHRRLAKSVAFALQKLVRREGLSLVVATSHDDIERDLQPDHVIEMRHGEPTVRSLSVRPKQSFSLLRRLRIERGSLRDYAAFAPMHYRQRDNPGFIDKVFVCREGVDGPVLGLVMYGRPSLELALRNRATCKRFSKNAARLNRELRVLKRLVVHPDLRGCGIGHWLVRRTLPLVGTRFVECLAAMGLVNPVFERAGMRCVGVVEAPAERERSVRAVTRLGANPLAADNWYEGTTCCGESRVQRQAPTFLAHTFRQLAGSQPVYYLWSRDERGWALIDRGQSEMID